MLNHKVQTKKNSKALDKQYKQAFNMFVDKLL